jgi:hypothetical protein
MVLKLLGSVNCVIKEAVYENQSLICYQCFVLSVKEKQATDCGGLRSSKDLSE